LPRELTTDARGVDIADLSDLHPALAELRARLVRDDGDISHGPNWVEFLATDAYVDANVRGGEVCIRVRAYLLDDGAGVLTDDEVRDWVERQPRPTSGVLEAFGEAQDDGSVRLLPRLVFEREISGFDTTGIEEDIFQFAEAWETKSIIGPQGNVDFRKFDPVSIRPQNAWLLMSDAASYPDGEELATAVMKGEVGIHDYLWTGPKNGETGDLALIYSTAPRTAACFVARLASRPFWRDDIDVNAEKVVESRQWWVYLSAPVEIAPIPYKTLREAQNGHLLLKGKSGHYLNPATIDLLAFRAKNPEQQSEVERIVRRPEGTADLPLAKDLTFEQWKRIPSGRLPLEAKVSEYVVEPLGRMLNLPSPQKWVLPELALIPEYRVPTGSVDFVLVGAKEPLTAVEVKLTVRRAASGIWGDSPDFKQLKRYMTDLSVPGLLIDAHSILLVREGADAPYDEIVRAEATVEDLDRIREHLFYVAHDKFGGTAGIPPNELPDTRDDMLEVYLAYLSIPGQGEGRAIDIPLVALLATSPASPAVEALPIIDLPVFRDLALKFLEGESCERVSEEYLGGWLMDPHSVATFLGAPLPEERPELLAMLGNLYAPRSGPTGERSARRRVARRA
jgi:hypothetical protein